ncbi:heavy-metal-associated domain-containing protein [Halobium salinum]|uniref:Heavy-metal-associated domain-containing protein n=1 Tax=Halobium salinum TaxID=1364940 RepID=A0ABD5PH10_9EURY
MAQRIHQRTPQQISLSVPDMDCPSCPEKIANSVSTLDGIHEVDP